jgi:hypothetical protein
MRGQRQRSGSQFSYVSIEERIPASHPLRRIRKLADQALDRLNPAFCELYAVEGRPSVSPEQLLLASLLQAFYGIRTIRSLQLFTTVSGRRLRKYTIIDGSKGAEYRNASRPMKNWRYGFSLICSTSSSSVSPRRALMIKAPSAMRKGFAGAPKPLQNCAA